MATEIEVGPYRPHVGEYMEHLKVVAIEDDYLVNPRPSPNLNKTYGMYTCQACGATVRDRAFHDQWGEGMDKRLAYVLTYVTKVIGALTDGT